MITELGRKATIHVAELSDTKAVGRIVPTLVEQGHTLDILVTCAGIQRRHEPEDFPDSDFNDVCSMRAKPCVSY